ncbi:MAG: hypothetical protein AAFN13_12900 [Bacteroidota bacterium]
MKIACPTCDWEPPADARWRCTCGHAWHTFDTGGRCPACSRVWRSTQCLACATWSPHHAWYRDLPDLNLDELLRPEVEEAVR